MKRDTSRLFYLLLIYSRDLCIGFFTERSLEERALDRPVELVYLGRVKRLMFVVNYYSEYILCLYKQLHFILSED